MVGDSNTPEPNTPEPERKPKVKKAKAKARVTTKRLPRHEGLWADVPLAVLKKRRWRGAAPADVIA